MPALDGRVEDGPEAVVAGDLQRLGPQLGGEVDQVVLGQPLHLVGGGPGGHGLRGREALARHLGLRHRPLLDGPDGLARRPVEGVGPALLRGLHDDAARPPVDGHVEGHRGGGVVEVPDVVVHGLEVPAALAGLDVEGDDAGAEEPVPGPEPPVEVDGRRVGGDVHEPQLGVGRHRRPRRHVAGPLPGVVLPRLVAELAGPRDDVELPEVLAGAGVVAQDVARHVLDAGLVVALLGRVADDDDAVDDDRGRRAGDVAQLAGDAEVGVVGAVPAQPRPPVGDEVGEQVDHAGAREARQRHRRPPVLEGQPGLCVEGVEKEGGADRIDDAPAVDLAPGDALAVAVPHAAVEPGGVRLAERPEGLAARGVDGDDGAALAGHRVQGAVDVNGSRAGHPKPRGPEVVAPPDPRHLEVVEVVGGDLVERGIAGVRGVAPDVAPLAGVLGASVRGERRDHGQEDYGEGDSRPRPASAQRSDSHLLFPSSSVSGRTTGPETREPEAPTLQPHGGLDETRRSARSRRRLLRRRRREDLQLPEGAPVRGQGRVSGRITVDLKQIGDDGGVLGAAEAARIGLGHQRRDRLEQLADRPAHPADAEPAARELPGVVAGGAHVAERPLAARRLGRREDAVEHRAGGRLRRRGSRRGGADRARALPAAPRARSARGETGRRSQGQGQRHRKAPPDQASCGRTGSPAARHCSPPLSRSTSGRASGTKPSRLGISTCGRVPASMGSSSPTRSLRDST